MFLGQKAFPPQDLWIGRMVRNKRRFHFYASKRIFKVDDTKITALSIYSRINKLHF